MNLLCFHPQRKYHISDDNENAKIKPKLSQGYISVNQRDGMDA